MLKAILKVGSETLKMVNNDDDNDDKVHLNKKYCLGLGLLK
jgi:hypothetical protein